MQPLLQWKSNKLYTTCMPIGSHRHPAMQCACALLSSVVGPAAQDISTLSLKGQDLRKEVTENKTCFEFIYNFCRKHFYSKKN